MTLIIFWRVGRSPQGVREGSSAVADAIVKTVKIPAQPGDVFNALLDGTIFAEATGAPAEIDAAPGGAFSCFGGIISGRNVEVLSGRTIVQAWRVKFWPDADYSLVRFDLEPVGEGAT